MKECHKRDRLKPERRKVCISAILALTMTLTQCVGYQVSAKYGTIFPLFGFGERTGVLSIVGCVMMGIAGWCIWTIILYVLYSFFDRREKAVWREKGLIGHRLFWIGFGILLALCWIPSLLGCYPGFYNYDIGGQLPQVMYDSVPYHTHHTLLHTLLAGGIINLGYQISNGSLEFGVFLHSVIQMLACMVCFTYTTYVIWKALQKRWLVIFAFCYYAFSPTIIMFAMSTTKDVPCALSLLLTVVWLYRMYKDPKSFWEAKGKVALLITSIVLSCLFRKNIVFGVLLFAVFNVCLFRKERKRLACMFVSAIMIYFVLDWGMTTILHAEKGSMSEALSIPFQQIARVYDEKGEEAFTPEEMEQIDAVISRVDLVEYNCFLADNIKNYTDFEVIKANKQTYLRLWLCKGIQYPDCYIRAFLDNTYQAWYPWTSVVDDPVSGHIYYFDYEGWDTIRIRPLITGIYDFYRKISSEVFYQKYPVVRLLFSTGTMLWMTIITWGYGMWSKKKQVTWVMLFILCVCGTALFGPISLVRYYLVLFYGFPVCIFLLVEGREPGIGVEREWES